MKQALVIAAKPPAPGRVKTRLSPPLTMEESAKLYECFLLDTISSLSSIEGVDKFIAFYPVTSKEYFLSIHVGDFTPIAQRGKDLGERMSGVFEQLFGDGYNTVSIIGSDAPTLPVDFIMRSFNELKKCSVDLTIGPCRDGGYYLIGMKRLYSRLFEDIAWSTSLVFECTIKRSKKLGLNIFVLPEWYDIDEAEDLVKLRDALCSTNNAAPKTKEFLMGLKID